MPKIKAVIFDCIDTLVKPGENSKSEITKTLKKLPVPYCIVTNDGTDIEKLQQVGMYECFKGRIFEAPGINGKKNLFNEISKNMQLKPQECLVIEDNIDGTKNASKSEMKILAYLGHKTTFVNYFDLRVAGAWGLLDEMEFLWFLTNNNKTR
ncbi:MAG: HAD-IA family hydrolase [Alphaproteobacteria bacterium]|nr:HAD-IA family hydrolase [Alphaproteobacteria bacterium]MBN2675428.1 HAD-IA family hydrolase [Alphaproteobacteria bacterium]